MNSNLLSLLWTASSQIYRAVYTVRNGIEFDFMRLKHEVSGSMKNSNAERMRLTVKELLMQVTNR